jgi:hypothetical protein
MSKLAVVGSNPLDGVFSMRCSLAVPLVRTSWTDIESSKPITMVTASRKLPASWAATGRRCINGYASLTNQGFSQFDKATNPYGRPANLTWRISASW